MTLLNYLKGHEYQAEAHPIASERTPPNCCGMRLPIEISTLFMGAYGRRGWREFLFGSTRIPLYGAALRLFLYHRAQAPATLKSRSWLPPRTGHGQDERRE